MSVLHTGHPDPMVATRLAERSQKRAWPQSTNAKPSHGATRHSAHFTARWLRHCAVCYGCWAGSGGIRGSRRRTVAFLAIIGASFLFVWSQRLCVRCHRVTDCAEKLQCAVCPGVKPRDACLNACFVQQVSFIPTPRFIGRDEHVRHFPLLQTPVDQCQSFIFRSSAIFRSVNFQFVTLATSSSFSSPAFSSPANSAHPKTRYLRHLNYQNLWINNKVRRGKM